MPNLALNTTLADRSINCSFSELFTSTKNVIINGGSISGDPSIHYGVSFDGVSDYISYSFSKSEIDNDELTFVMEFYPDFDFDFDANVPLYYFDGSSTHSLIKLDNSGSNELVLSMSSTVLVSIPASTYGPHWKVGVRNVIVVAAKSGLSYIWLNGVKLTVSHISTVFSSSTITSLLLGILPLSAGGFPGKITQFKVYKYLASSGNGFIDDIVSNSLYKYSNDTVLHLPMRSVDHDATNNRSLDVSKYSNHAVFGDGVTPATFPTKIPGKSGYYFDGVNTYLNCGTGTSLNLRYSFTIFVVFEVITDRALTTYRALVSKAEEVDDGYLVMTGNLNRNMYIRNSGGALQDTTVDYIYPTVSNYLGYKSEVSFFAITIDSGGNYYNSYLNGINVYGSRLPLWTVYRSSPTQPLYIGALSGSSLFFKGNIYEVIIFNKELSELQIKDLTIDMQRRYSDE